MDTDETENLSGRSRTPVADRFVPGEPMTGTVATPRDRLLLAVRVAIGLFILGLTPMLSVILGGTRGGLYEVYEILMATLMLPSLYLALAWFLANWRVRKLDEEGNLKRLIKRYRWYFGSSILIGVAYQWIATMATSPGAAPGGDTVFWVLTLLVYPPYLLLFILSELTLWRARYEAQRTESS